MSEKSFAVASVSVAIVWGAFFYPPAPRLPGSDEARPAPIEAASELPLRPEGLSRHAVLTPAPAHNAHPSSDKHNSEPKNDCPPGVINNSAKCSIAQN
jgi:hypothetical protein